MQSDYARDHGWTIGTTVPVTFPDGTTSTLTVDAIYGLKNLFGDLIVTTGGYVPHATQPTDVVILMTPAAGVTRDAAKAAAQQVSTTFYAPDVQTRSEYLDSVNAQIDQLLAFVYGLLAVAVIIAVIGIGNTISLSVYERTRELGLLRAIGQSRRRVRTMVRGEASSSPSSAPSAGCCSAPPADGRSSRAIGADQGIVRFALPLDRIAVVVALGALAGILAAQPPGPPRRQARRARGDRHQLTTRHAAGGWPSRQRPRWRQHSVDAGRTSGCRVVQRVWTRRARLSSSLARPAMRRSVQIGSCNGSIAICTRVPPSTASSSTTVSWS